MPITYPDMVKRYTYKDMIPNFKYCFSMDFEDSELAHDLLTMDFYFDIHPEEYDKALRDWKEDVIKQFEQYKKEYIAYWGKRFFALLLQEWIRDYRHYLQKRQSKKRYFWWDIIFDEFKRMKKWECFKDCVRRNKN